MLGLPDGLLARYLRLADLLLEFGPNLGMPHTKTVKEGLFELRIKSKEGIARVFYCTVINKRICMLHIFTKKSQKIPKKELKLAMSRLKEVKKMKHSELKEKALKRKGFHAEYKSMEPEFALLRAMLLARQTAGLSQAQVAKRMGTKPPAITRLESSLISGKHSPSLATIKKYAEAVGCHLEIGFVQNE